MDNLNFVDKVLNKAYEDLKKMDSNSNAYADQLKLINQLCQTKNEENKIRYEAAKEEGRLELDKVVKEKELQLKEKEIGTEEAKIISNNEIQEKELQIQAMQAKNEKLKVWTNVGTTVFGVAAGFAANMLFAKIQTSYGMSNPPKLMEILFKKNN